MLSELKKKYNNLNQLYLYFHTIDFFSVTTQMGYEMFKVFFINLFSQCAR